MTIRPYLLSRQVAIAWFLSFVAFGCGGQPGPTAGDDPPTDVTPPTIVAKFPADGQESVPINTVVAITFSEAIDVRSLNRVNAEITLFQAVSGTLQPVQKASQWESASNTLFVRPSTLLEPDRHYTVRITNNIGDPTGNRLDTGTSDGLLVWRFTTGTTFDNQKPVWSPNKTVRAVADRYDAITVCWWDGPPPPAPCDASVESLDPAAYDPPTNDSNGLIYTVQYKRSVDAGFTSLPSGLGAHRVALPNLVASTVYEIQVLVSDVAANQADEIVVADLVPTPPAGRLYAGNQVGNSLAMIPDAAQAQGDRSGTVVSTGETQLVAPTGIVVDQAADLVYVADPSANMIAAYKLNYQTTVNGQTVNFGFGEYGIGHNMKPEWAIQGTLTSTDLTGLCGPSTLRLESRVEGTTTRKILYAANSLSLPTPFAPVCLPDSILAFDITQAPQGPNQPPIATLRPGAFRGPLGFAVDESRKLLYTANRDDFRPGDKTGWSIQVFSYDPNLEDLDSAPHRTFWGTVGDRCQTPSTEPASRICGPTAVAFEDDGAGGRLYVVNREKSNILVFSDVANVSGQQTPVVVAGPNTGLDGARPTSIFLDAAKDRVYITTDAGQSVLIFDKNDLVTGGNVAPLRVIKGTKTLLGQPAVSPAFPSHGPFGVTVVENDQGVDEAYVVTPGLFDAAGLTPIPNVAVFDVSVGKDSSPRNTPPDRVLINPLLGPTGMALDLVEQRLYVASFHSNMILVYDEPREFVSGLKAPDRIIAGPATRLDHPVALLFRRDSFEQGTLYVVNQSSHSVAVFQEGETAATLLQGNEEPSRYVGPPEGTDPFVLANVTELASPTGLAIDPINDILYVSNRDAAVFQDLVGRRIVAFQEASTVTGNMPPTWKIEGDPPPNPNCTVGCTPVTDKTTLKRPAGLLLIPDPAPADGVADDRLVVANRGNNTVLIFRGLSDLVTAAQPPDDNRAPTWTIANASLTNPFGLAFDARSNDLYVSDANSSPGKILSVNIGTLSLTTPVPSLQPRVIQGSSTGLLTPHGLALDPQLDP